MVDAVGWKANLSMKLMFGGGDVLKGRKIQQFEFDYDQVNADP